MDLTSIRELVYCQPSDWQIDLTPPDPDDNELSPWVDFANIGRAIGTAFMGLNVILNVANEVSWTEVYAKELIERYNNALKPIAEIGTQIIKMDDAANGMHEVTSQSSKVDLPVRRFNSGPAKVPFKKRGR